MGLWQQPCSSTASVGPALRKAARSALDEFSSRKIPAADWDAFAASLDYVPLAAGAPEDMLELMATLGNDQGGLPFSVAFNARGGVAERKLGQLKPDDLARWVAAVG